MKVTGEELTDAISKTLTIEICNTVFVCIGTDRSTGDSLGPLTGSALEGLGFDVMGTLDDPIHAENLKERLKEIPEDKTVIAIDACLGQFSSVGKFVVNKGPMKPGAGIPGRDLGEVGDYSIAGVVNVGGFMEHFVLQNTRLSLVMNMARNIVSSISQTFALPMVAATKEES